jgi:hypothetical protein
MGALLDSVKTKKKKEPDRFFYVAFDSPDQVYGTRGFSTRRDLSEYLLDRQMPGIKMKLTSNACTRRRRRVERAAVDA